MRHPSLKCHLLRQSSSACLPLLAFSSLILACLCPTVAHAHPFPPPNQLSAAQHPPGQLLPLLGQDSLQIPFKSPLSQPSNPKVLVAGQDLPEETLTLRHLLHHGGARYPRLFKRMDVNLDDVAMSESLTGESLTHQLKVKATTTLKPRDQSYRNQGFRSLDTSISQESWTKETIPGPDITDKDTVLQLAKINYNSYTEVSSPGWYDLEGQWSVVSVRQ